MRHGAENIVWSEQQVQFFVFTNGKTLYCVVNLVTFIPEFHCILV